MSLPIWLLPVAVLALPSAITALTYLRRWWLDAADPDPAPPLPAMARLVAFVAECLAATALALTWPIGKMLVSGHHARGDAAIVLVPAAGLNAASLWPLAWRLERCGRPVRIAPSPSWRHEVRAAATRLAGILAPAAEGPLITVIAFGSAGWVARELLRHRPPGIARLITLATLHSGPLPPGLARCTPLARGAIGTAFPPGGGLPPDLEVVSIASDFDASAPATQAYCPGAFNIEVSGIGHTSLLLSPKVFELLAENLGPG